MSPQRGGEWPDCLSLAIGLAVLSAALVALPFVLLFWAASAAGVTP